MKARMDTHSSSPEDTILILGSDAEEFSPILDELALNYAFSLLIVDEMDDFWKCLDDGAANTLLLSHDSLTDDALGDLTDYVHDDLFMVLINSEKLITDEDDDIFDVVLELNDNFEFNLKQFLKIRRKSLRQCSKILERVQQLESDLVGEKRHSDEIEILKNAIVRNVSHELKTPLLHVKSAVSLMAEDAGPDNKLIRYAENATARLETLVTNITMFGSSLDFNLGPVILRDSVEYARRNLGRIWEQRSETKRIVLHIDEDLPPVVADKQGLSTILQLLMDNALKFSSDEIEVHAHRVRNQIEVSVKDYGIGIAPADMKSIFDSFYQIDSSSTRRYGGAGVGLALVNLLLEHHDSKIKVESKVNKGSTFSFKLKIANLH